MRTLLLMRHAKSSWKGELPDRQRPLKGRGRRDAPRMGAYLAAHLGAPDLIVCSPAERAAVTARLVAEACGFAGDIQLREELYGGDASAYLAVVRSLNEAATTALLVGHNPATEMLWACLTGREERLVTAAIGVLRLGIMAWADLGERPPIEDTALWTPGAVEAEAH